MWISIYDIPNCDFKRVTLLHVMTYLLTTGTVHPLVTEDKRAHTWYTSGNSRASLSPILQPAYLNARATTHEYKYSRSPFANPLLFFFTEHERCFPKPLPGPSSLGTPHKLPSAFGLAWTCFENCLLGTHRVSLGTPHKLPLNRFSWPTRLAGNFSNHSLPLMHQFLLSSYLPSCYADNMLWWRSPPFLWTVGRVRGWLLRKRCHGALKSLLSTAHERRQEGESVCLLVIQVHDLLKYTRGSCIN